jgi:hypothetical protein
MMAPGGVLEGAEKAGGHESAFRQARARNGGVRTLRSSSISSIIISSSSSGRIWKNQTSQLTLNSIMSICRALPEAMLMPDSETKSDWQHVPPASLRTNECRWGWWSGGKTHEYRALATSREAEFHKISLSEYPYYLNLSSSPAKSYLTNVCETSILSTIYYLSTISHLPSTLFQRHPPRRREVMPALSSISLLDTLVARNANATATATNATSNALQVVCAFPVSGQYGPGSRIL